NAMCKGGTPTFSNPLTKGPWNGWGVTTSNARFQNEAGFSAAEVPRLKLKWAFAFPGDLSANAQPVVAGGRVFVGSPGGIVYSLNSQTGCVYWYFQAEGGVRTAITIAPTTQTPSGSGGYTAFFG